MNIEVSNLHLNLTETDLERMFAPFGEVSSIQLLRDKLNNRSRGRAFVEMHSEKAAQKALDCLDGTEVMGRTIRVSKVSYKPAQKDQSVDKPDSLINRNHS